MPRLLLFAGCEKAIVDQRTNVVSLMSLVHEINVQIPPGAPPPPSSAIIPMQWTIVSIFLAEPGDGGKQFESRATLTKLDGTELFTTPVSLFTIQDQHRIFSQVNGMPIGNAGPLLVKCYLRESGVNEWREIAKGYPIVIKWQPPTPAPMVH